MSTKRSTEKVDEKTPKDKFPNENEKKRSDEFLPAVNRKYKDTLFRMVFKEKEDLLSLYNAVNETDYTDPDDLEIVTLENAVFMNMKNDLAFLFLTDLNLYEHQSTFCPNMPLRMLYYIAAEYQKIVKDSDLYRLKSVKLPAPKFVVFYNGVKMQAERQQFKLSDLFCAKENEPELELKVTMLNINLGQNEKLMNACKTLYDYARFVALIRRYSAETDIRSAVVKAVDECIRDGILYEFLNNYRSEAIAMSLYEYNEEEVLRCIREDERELGFEEGKAEGEVTAFIRDIEHLMKSLKLDLAKACTAIGRSEEEYYAAKDLLEKNRQAV